MEHVLIELPIYFEPQGLTDTQMLAINKPNMSEMKMCPGDPQSCGFLFGPLFLRVSFVFSGVCK